MRVGGGAKLGASRARKTPYSSLQQGQFVVTKMVEAESVLNAPGQSASGGPQFPCFDGFLQRPKSGVKPFKNRVNQLVVVPASGTPRYAATGGFADRNGDGVREISVQKFAAAFLRQKQATEINQTKPQ